MVGLCLNIRNSAISQYRNFNFTGFTVSNDTILATAVDGIYLVGIAWDDNGIPINSYMELPNTDFGLIQKKNFTRAYLGGLIRGDITIELVPDDNRKKEISTTISPEQNYGRLASSVFGRYWQTKIKNVWGSDFRIDSIDLSTPLPPADRRGQRPPIPVFRGTTGLNNRVPPERLKNDKGVVELSAAVNIDIDDNGTPIRRKGYKKILDIANPHSIWCDGFTLFVFGNSLCQFLSDYTYRVIATVTPNAPVSYINVNNTIFWTNGYENGAIANNATVAWTRPADIPIPPHYVSEVGTTMQFYDPPIGNLLEYFNSRIYIAQGNTLWYSHPYYYSYFRMATDRHIFPSDITMLAAVDDGLYVSDCNSTYFLQGLTAPDMKLIKLSEKFGPAIKGTAVAAEIMTKAGKADGIMWMCPSGICYGLPGGEVENITEEKLIYPKRSRGAAVYRNSKYFAVLLD